MKSFLQYLTSFQKGRTARQRIGDLFATVAMTGAVANSPLAGHVAKAYDTAFPSPWKQLQPYLTKHPISGKLVLDEDKLSEEEKKKVRKLLAKLEAQYSAKKSSK